MFRFSSTGYKLFNDNRMWSRENISTGSCHITNKFQSYIVWWILYFYIANEYYIIEIAVDILPLNVYTLHTILKYIVCFSILYWKKKKNSQTLRLISDVGNESSERLLKNFLNNNNKKKKKPRINRSITRCSVDQYAQKVQTWTRK